MSASVATWCLFRAGTTQGCWVSSRQRTTADEQQCCSKLLPTSAMTTQCNKALMSQAHQPPVQFDQHPGVLLNVHSKLSRCALQANSSRAGMQRLHLNLAAQGVMPWEASWLLFNHLLHASFLAAGLHT